MKKVLSMMDAGLSVPEIKERLKGFRKGSFHTITYISDSSFAYGLSEVFPVKTINVRFGCAYGNTKIKRVEHAILAAETVEMVEKARLAFDELKPAQRGCVRPWVWVSLKSKEECIEKGFRPINNEAKPEPPRFVADRDEKAIKYCKNGSILLEAMNAWAWDSKKGEFKQPKLDFLIDGEPVTGKDQYDRIYARYIEVHGPQKDISNIYTFNIHRIIDIK